MGATKNSVLFLICFWMFSCLSPAAGWAALVVKSDVVSGNVVKINEDHSIVINNGKTYHPSRKSLEIDVAVGQPISLRYIVEDIDRYVFFEYALGLNTLKKISSPIPTKSNDQK